MQREYNRTYFVRDNKALKYDLFSTDSNEKLPLVFFVHGGGWIQGDKSMFHSEAEWLAQQGFACACVEYRLSPESTYPGCLADIQRFIQHARKNHQELGIDPEKIIAFGNSAGGYISGFTGLTDKYFGQDSDPELDNISCKANKVVSICGIFDIGLPQIEDYADGMDFLEIFMGCKYKGNENLWKEASPYNHVNNEATPYLLVHGNADTLVPYQGSTRFHEKLIEHNVESKIKIIENAEHSFTLPQWEEIRKEYLPFTQADNHCLKSSCAK